MSTLEMQRVRVRLDGAELSDADAASLVSVLVRQELSSPTVCELAFAEPAGRLAAARLEQGAALELRVDDAHEPLFRGSCTASIQAFGPQRERGLRLRAYDALHGLRARRPLRAHVELCTAELARELVGELGLELDASTEGPFWPRILQHRHSDLELLRQLSAWSGLGFHLRGQCVQLFPLDGGSEGPALELGRELIELELEENTDATWRAVGVHGWDASRALERGGQAGDEEHQHNGLALTGLALASDAEAEALAGAQLAARSARREQCRGIALGDARLHPGARVRIAGPRPARDGSYTLTRALHRIDAERGWLCEFSSAPLPPALPEPGASATFGVVVSLDDPESLGRVQVRLPALGDLLSGWMEVVTSAAGEGKGIVAQPDVDDRVVVLFTRAVTAQGVVLGGLYGERGLPAGGPEDGRTRRFVLCTPGGQRVVLDDLARSARVETAAGSFIELGPDSVHLYAAADITVEAPGRQLLFGAKRVDFVER